MAYMKKKKNPYYNNNQDQEKPFNMAIIFLERLNNRLNECNEASIRGDILTWYRGLRAIYRMIHFKVIEKGQEEQENELKEIFTKAKKMLVSGSAKLQNNQMTNQMSQLSLSNTEIILDELEIKLNDLLFKYGLIFPPEYKPKSIEEHIAGAFEQ